MISAELFVIFLVACVVFGPTKLPMLARHLGLVFGQMIRFREQFFEQLKQFEQDQLSAQQLSDNQHKAEVADALYRKNRP